MKEVAKNKAPPPTPPLTQGGPNVSQSVSQSVSQADVYTVVSEGMMPCTDVGGRRTCLPQVDVSPRLEFGPCLHELFASSSGALSRRASEACLMGIPQTLKSNQSSDSPSERRRRMNHRLNHRLNLIDIWRYEMKSKSFQLVSSALWSD
jgi:hypothetical protein